MEKMPDYKESMDRARRELDILYETGNALRASLNLAEVLDLMLGAIAAKQGLAFDRAMVFLVNEKDNTIEGRRANKKVLDQVVRAIKIPLKETSGIIAQTALDGMPFEITNDHARQKVNEQIIKRLKTKYFVTAPIKARDRVLGVILADNNRTNKSISKDDLRMLTLFANQAALAIENAYLYGEVLHQSKIDSLTGLWNHVQFHNILDAKLKNQDPENPTPVSLILIDLDHFKFYNDTHGHQSGDEILKLFAQLLLKTRRRSDAVCRYGGEEFAIILDDVGKQPALKFSQRLLKTIQNHPFPKKETQPEGNITASIGIATFPDDTTSKDDLLYKADVALYEAKRQGRNCAVGYGL